MSATPPPSSEVVTRVMKRMRRRDTAPEMALRRELTRLGLRYRLHRPDLPGRPDVAFGPARVAVFVDGCFWHSCPEHGVLPRANRVWWADKLARNAERDREKDRALETMDWLAIHVWEHEDAGAAAVAIQATVLHRRAPRR